MSSSSDKLSDFSRMIEMKDVLHQSFCEETRRLQLQSQEQFQRILYEQEALKTDLENQRKLLDARSRELNKREAELAKKKNDLRTIALELASDEQRKQTRMCKL